MKERIEFLIEQKEKELKELKQIKESCEKNSRPLPQCINEAIIKAQDNLVNLAIQKREWEANQE